MSEAAGARQRTTTEEPGANWSRRERINSLIRLFRRFLSVASGTCFLEITIPTCTGLVSSFGDERIAVPEFGTAIETTMIRFAPRRPRRNVDENSSLVVRRFCRGNTDGSQAARRERPLRRRLAITARPERVRIRNRNPCTLCRRRLLG